MWKYKISWIIWQSLLCQKPNALQMLFILYASEVLKFELDKDWSRSNNIQDGLKLSWYFNKQYYKH